MDGDIFSFFQEIQEERLRLSFASENDLNMMAIIKIIRGKTTELKRPHAVTNFLVDLNSECATIQCGQA